MKVTYMTQKITLAFALLLGLSACMGTGVTDAPEPGETTGQAIQEPTDGLENEIETE